MVKIGELNIIENKKRKIIQKVLESKHVEGHYRLKSRMEIYSQISEITLAVLTKMLYGMVT